MWLLSCLKLTRFYEVDDEEQIIVDAINKKFQPKKPNSK